MRRLILFACLMICSIPLWSQQKTALLIAGGAYEYWKPTAAEFDARYMKESLTRLGFSKFHTLKNKELTVSNLDSVFNALLTSSEKGDQVMIHFAGHGVQIEDDNGDEADRLDEALVTYPAKLLNTPLTKEEFENVQKDYYRDDRLYYWIQRIRQKLSKEGRLTFISDACHSGSGIRGEGVSRGGASPIVTTSFTQQPQKTGRTDLFYDATEAKADQESLAPYVYMAAAESYELNWESKNEKGENVGSLTYAFCRAMTTADSSASYSELFSQIRIFMQEQVPFQNPVLQGNGLQQLVFGNRFSHDPAFNDVETILDPKQLIINKGELHDVSEGDSVIIEAGTFGITVRGVILKADLLSSKALLTSGIPSGLKPSVLRVIPLKKKTPGIIGVYIVGAKPGSAGFSPQQVRNLSQRLSSLKFVTVDKVRRDLQLVKGNLADTLKSVAAGDVVGIFPAEAGVQEALTDKLMTIARIRKVRSTNIADEDLNVEVSLVPIINGLPAIALADSMTRSGAVELSVGSKVYLRIKNLTKNSFYVNILSVQSTDEMSSLLPNSNCNISASDLLLGPSAQILFSNCEFNIQPPTGMEVLKIICSKRKINLEQALGSASREIDLMGSDEVINQLFFQPVNERTVDSTANNVNSESVKTLIFRIVE